MKDLMMSLIYTFGPLSLMLIGASSQFAENALNLVVPIFSGILILGAFVVMDKADDTARKKSDKQVLEYFEKRDKNRTRNRFYRGLMLMGNLWAVLIMAGNGWYWFSILWLIVIFAIAIMISETIKAMNKLRKEVLARENGDLDILENKAEV